jgi:flavodoxin
MAYNILIAYYSWAGSTRRVAEQLHTAAGGELFEIIPQAAYPGDYNICVTQAKKEIQEGFKPELKTKIDDIKPFDIILLGTPNWWSSLAPPAASFLSAYDLSGKTIAPFLCHGGGGQGHIVKDIEKLCPASTVLPCLAIGGKSTASTAELAAWLKQAGILPA